MVGTGRRRWVLIETGGNQAFIFDSNRLRHAVGASHLVHLVGTEWAVGAAEANGADVALTVSGKALLLVEDEGRGRAVIEAVSRRVLAEAPGLDVTGCVGPEFDPSAAWPDTSGGYTHVEALDATYERFAVVRAARPSAGQRDLLLPWFEVCRDSGLGSAGVEEHPDGVDASAPVLAKSMAARPGRDRMRDLLADVPEVVPRDLDALGEAGWIAVVHVDGNGVGQVFTRFAENARRVVGGRALSLSDHVRLLGSFARELDEVTQEAFWLAVRTVAADRDERDDAILPIVLGGDDVTFACRARFALPLVREFAGEFERLSAESPTVSGIAGGGLSCAGGIAYVKPHHPFSAAYGLAEELTASAKRFKATDGVATSAVDFQVVFEPALADLDRLRGDASNVGVSRHGGPYVLGEAPSVPVRDIALLDGTRGTVGALSSSLAHELREGLALGRAHFVQRIDHAARSVDLPARLRPEDLRALAPVRDEGTGEEFVRMLDAMLLDSVEAAS